jgi:hypothetical protein
MKERIAYVCEHCNKHKRNKKAYLSKDKCKQHEKRCFYNTNNKTCWTCIHDDGMNKCNINIKVDNGINLMDIAPITYCQLWSDDWNKYNGDESDGEDK